MTKISENAKRTIFERKKHLVVREKKPKKTPIEKMEDRIDRKFKKWDRK